MSENPFAPSDFPSNENADTKSYSVEGPPKQRFLPWHHPRKQFVRSEQWATIIEEHLAAHPIAGRPLTYIGLPGDDLLDIRYFADRICIPRTLPLLYLGLNANIDSNSGRRTRVDSAMFDIRTQYSLVSAESDVVSDAFASIAKSKSIISRKMDEFGFFDVVNLDLCDGLAKNQPGAAQAGNYEAIQFLLGRQMKSRSSWLLFLTTRVGDQHCDHRTKQVLEKLVCRNESDCKGFAESVVKLCGASLALANPEQKLLVINLVGLIKWLGSMCISESGWKMDTLAIDSYTVWRESPVEDLFSVALRFVPIESPAQDPIGLGTAQPQTDDECRIALEVMDQMIGRRNVDNILSSDQDLYARTVAEKSKLLLASGLDVTQYIEQITAGWRLPHPMLRHLA